MISSMTGFGRSSLRLASIGFELEIRSVNQRHLEARVRVPPLLASFEPELRARIQRRLQRGKVDLSVSIASDAAASPRVELDRAVAESYARASRELAAIQGVAGALSVDALIALPGVARLSEPELPADRLLEALLGAADRALDALAAMRAAEGQAIERDLLARLAAVEALTASIEQRSHGVRESVCERLRKRTEQLRLETGLLDEARLHQEIALAADRLDVAEELVRLRSHVDQFREIVRGAAADAPVGRRLEFLLQELAREANTIGSKCGDAPIAHHVVELKTELERIREQVQNVE
ncbi:MAG TPA: YicC/YloC family endoribonuclease [Myxococcota bacterium]|nr:YicC/YloC family endoribonuclease [Myxococcota bacterium]